MNKDRIEGASKQFKGKVQQAWGRMNGDQALVFRGKANELSGSAQASFGRAMAATRGAFGYRRRLGA